MKKFYYFVTLSLFGLFFIWGGGCGSPTSSVNCETDKDCGADSYCDTKEGKCKSKSGAEGSKEVVPGEKKKSDKEMPSVDKMDEGGPADGGGEAVPEKAPEVVPDDGGGLCPPGCVNQQCKGGNANSGGSKKKLKLGDPCQAPKKPGEKDPCAANGFVCVMNGIQGKGYCAKVCNSDSDCKDLADTKCVERGDNNNKKICGKLVKEGDDCNYSAQNFCDNGLICLISDLDRTAGICYKPCQKDSECSKDKVCRNFSPQSSRKLCMEPVLPGPKCLGESCSSFSTAQNCKEGLKCIDGVCVKGCDPKKGDKDCDTKKGEKCFFSPFSKNPPFCQPPPKVTEVGKKCDFYNRCDPKKGLKCINTGQESICMKTCDPKKGTDNNPDCPAKTKCSQTQGGQAFCMYTAKTDEKCGTKACGEKFDVCVRMTQTDAYCLRLCNSKQNDKDGKNPACSSGKGECVKLRSSITRDGKTFDGVCLPFRPKTLDIGGDCSFKGANSPTCKDNAICVGLGGGTSVCLPKCDPCQNKRVNGKWVHPKCKGNSTEQCIGLVRSDGSSAGGVCIVDGKKIRDEDEYCDFQNGCKDGLICVRFSSRDDAKSVCAKKCTPGPNSQDDCNGGRCAGLRSGGGVCIPQPKRKKKLGETCSSSIRDIGTPDFNDCLENDNGKKLICAQSPFPGAPRTCQIFCDPTKGFKDNSDCKAAGLNDHLCLPADYRYPNRGACLQKCTFVNRLTCETSKCNIGQCRELLLGKRGSCKTQQGKQDCKNRGGVCVNNNCVASVCL